MDLLVKGILLLSSAGAVFYGTTPPRPTDDKKVVYKGQIFEYVLHGMGLIWRTLFFGTVLGHIAVALSLRYPELDELSPVSILPYICANPSPSLPALSALTPTFLSGAGLVIAGGAVRLWCYDTLGRHFTYKVTILDKHSLVTGGPYAIVRHPSYTGLYMMLLGCAVIFSSSDGYMASCNIRDTPVVWLLYLWQLMGVYAFYALVRRTSVEDSELKRSFGEKWDKYSQQVRYRLFPYIV